MTTGNLITRAREMWSQYTRKQLQILALEMAGELERLRAERDSDLFDFEGIWHVRHADGTTEDIVFSHGNLVEDATGTCGQFILKRRVENR